MKSKVYYWIAIGVLVLTTIFFAVLAQIQTSYAQSALYHANEQQALAKRHAELATEQAQLAQERAAEAERSRNEAVALMEQLQKCKASK